MEKVWEIMLWANSGIVPGPRAATPFPI